MRRKSRSTAFPEVAEGLPRNGPKRRDWPSVLREVLLRLGDFRPISVAIGGECRQRPIIALGRFGRAVRARSGGCPRNNSEAVWHDLVGRFEFGERLLVH